MYVPLFPLYGFGLIQIKPKRKRKALGFFLAVIKENHTGNTNKNLSWRSAMELLRKIIHS